MDRRNFLSGSLAASTLSLAASGDLLAQAQPTSAKSALRLSAEVSFIIGVTAGRFCRDFHRGTGKQSFVGGDK